MKRNVKESVKWVELDSLEFLTKCLRYTCAFYKQNKVAGGG